MPMEAVRVASVRVAGVRVAGVRVAAVRVAAATVRVVGVLVAVRVVTMILRGESSDAVICTDCDGRSLPRSICFSILPPKK